jgi:hypothetical protein
VSPANRYLPTYRAAELHLTCQMARRGESMAFVGVAGIGKSNLFKILQDGREFKTQYLGDAVDRVHFAAVDATTWQQTPLHLWQLMAEALQLSTGTLGTPPADTVVPLSEEERIRRRLQSHIDWICQQLGHQLVFVLDDFDAGFKAGPLTMLEQLYSLRSAGNRGQLAYLTFTKRLPHVLGRHYGLGDSSKFYDLLRRNIYALGPYTPEDTRQMLRHLNHQAGSPLGREALGQIEFLAGGHGGLTKAIFDTWLREPPASTAYHDHFAAKGDVRAECRRLLRGLHSQEQAAALRLAQGRGTTADAPLLDHLARRGLLLDTQSGRWFSALFSTYLRTTKEEPSP